MDDPLFLHDDSKNQDQSTNFFAKEKVEPEMFKVENLPDIKEFAPHDIIVLWLFVLTTPFLFTNPKDLTYPYALMIAVNVITVCILLALRLGTWKFSLDRQWWVQVFLDTYIIVVFIIQFEELGVFHSEVHSPTNTYYDWWCQSLELEIFGEQISQTLRYSISNMYLSYYLKILYTTYYFIVIIPFFWLWLKSPRRDFLMGVCAIEITWLACFLVSALVPVLGPSYTFDNDGVMISEEEMVISGMKGTAFPAQQVAISFSIWIVCWFYQVGVAQVLCLFVPGLWFAVIYEGYHYGVDVLFGICVGCICTFLGLWFAGLYLGRDRTPTKSPIEANRLLAFHSSSSSSSSSDSASNALNLAVSASASASASASSSSSSSSSSSVSPESAHSKTNNNHTNDRDVFIDIHDTRRHDKKTRYQNRPGMHYIDDNYADHKAEAVNRGEDEDFHHDDVAQETTSTTMRTRPGDIAKHHLLSDSSATEANNNNEFSDDDDGDAGFRNKILGGGSHASHEADAGGLGINFAAENNNNNVSSDDYSDTEHLREIEEFVEYEYPDHAMTVNEEMKTNMKRTHRMRGACCATELNPAAAAAEEADFLRKIKAIRSGNFEDMDKQMNKVLGNKREMNLPYQQGDGGIDDDLYDPLPGCLRLKHWLSFWLIFWPIAIFGCLMLAIELSSLSPTVLKVEGAATWWQCEPLHELTFAFPASSWTSGSFLVAAVLIVTLAPAASKLNAINAYPQFNKWFVASTIFLLAIWTLVAFAANFYVGYYFYFFLEMFTYLVCLSITLTATGFAWHLRYNQFAPYSTRTYQLAARAKIQNWRPTIFMLLLCAFACSMVGMGFIWLVEQEYMMRLMNMVCFVALLILESVYRIAWKHQDAPSESELETLRLASQFARRVRVFDGVPEDAYVNAAADPIELLDGSRPVDIKTNLGWLISTLSLFGGLFITLCLEWAHVCQPAFPMTAIKHVLLAALVTCFFMLHRTDEVKFGHMMASRFVDEYSDDEFLRGHGDGFSDDDDFHSSESDSLLHGGRRTRNAIGA